MMASASLFLHPAEPLTQSLCLLLIRVSDWLCVEQHAKGMLHKHPVTHWHASVHPDVDVTNPILDPPMVVEYSILSAQPGRLPGL
jgi:hypothetical protein